MLERRRIDLSGRALAAPEAEALAAALHAGAVLDARVVAQERADELLAEVVALQRAHFDPAVDSYSQLLVGPGRAIFNWGTGGEEGAEPVDLGAFPRLRRLVADAVALSRALGPPGQETLLSVVPSLRKIRTFPRFYHRDSHASVAEIAADGGESPAPSCYRMVWDVGLENSFQVLNVDLVPRRALADAAGQVEARYRHLFQRQNLDFRAMSDAEIDAVQPQMREEVSAAPRAPARPRPRPGADLARRPLLPHHLPPPRAQRRRAVRGAALDPHRPRVRPRGLAGGPVVGERAAFAARGVERRGILAPMPRITKVTTRTGDRGETGLGSGRRVPKDAPRIEAYGTVDELSSAIGVAIAAGLEEKLAGRLRAVQNELFHLGADLCIPEEDKARHPGPRIEAHHVEALEAFQDELAADLAPLKNFVLPGGAPGAAQLHVARTVCRRAERLVVTLAREEAVGPEVVRYLNRLSDVLFTMARWENQRKGVVEPLWDSRA